MLDLRVAIEFFDGFAQECVIEISLGRGASWFRAQDLRVSPVLGLELATSCSPAVTVVRIRGPGPMLSGETVPSTW